MTEIAIDVKHVEALCEDLCRARRSPWLRANHLRGCETLLSLPEVVALSAQLRSGIEDAAFITMMDCIEGDLDPKYREATRLFYNLDQDRALENVTARNDALRKVWKPPVKDWSHRVDYIEFVADLARALLRRDSPSEPQSAQWSDDQPQQGRLANNRRLLGPEVDAYERVLTTPLGICKEKFLGGLFMPWSIEADVRELALPTSLIGLGNFLAVGSRSVGELIRCELLEREDKMRFGVVIRMVLDETRPMWIQQFEFPAMNGLEWFMLMATSWDNDFTSLPAYVDRYLKKNPLDVPTLPDRWEQWMASCDCPVNAVNEEVRRVAPWSELFAPTCYVHRNLWVDDIRPHESDHPLTLDDRMWAYLGREREGIA